MAKTTNTTKENTTKKTIVPVNVTMATLTTTTPENMKKALSVFDSKLRPEMNKLIKAVSSERKGTWDFAYGVVKIVNDSLYDVNFKTQNDFASYVNVSAGRLSQMKKAIAFLEKHPTIVRDSITLDHAYQLSRIDDMGPDFLTWCTDNNILLESEKAISKAITSYKNKDKQKDNESDNVTHVSTENVIIGADKNGRKIMFTIQGKTFVVPENELMKYIVK